MSVRSTPRRVLLRVAAPLLCLGACACPDEHRVRRIGRDVLPVEVRPSGHGPMVLERVDGSFEPVDVPEEGGEFDLPRGAWVLRSPESEVPAVAVPVFGDGPLCVGVRSSRPGDDEFATIPAGPALIGDRLGVGQPDERPLRIVDLPEFQIGRHEITNARFVSFLNQVDELDAIDSWLDLRSRKCRIQRADDGSFVTDEPDLPVVTVSFAGAQAYCAWRTGLVEDPEVERIRLPTEVEWEKAARGPESSVYAYGDVYTPSAANQESGHLMAVGSFPPNGFGLFDMTGNAFEWTSDLEATPADRSTPRIYLRSGSFVLDGIFLRNAFRMLLRPTVRADDVGFRIVREFRSETERRAPHRR